MRPTTIFCNEVTTRSPNPNPLASTTLVSASPISKNYNRPFDKILFYAKPLPHFNTIASIFVFSHLFSGFFIILSNDSELGSFASEAYW